MDKTGDEKVEIPAALWYNKFSSDFALATYLQPKVARYLVDVIGGLCYTDAITRKEHIDLCKQILSLYW